VSYRMPNLAVSFVMLLSAVPGVYFWPFVLEDSCQISQLFKWPTTLSHMVSESDPSSLISAFYLAPTSPHACMSHIHSFKNVYGVVCYAWHSLSSCFPGPYNLVREEGHQQVNR
jgi:hypothetical protein